MIIRPIESKDIEAILELNQTSVKVLSPLDRSAVLSLIGMSALSVVLKKTIKWLAS